MPTRDAVARGLIELRTWWPSMPDTTQLVDSIQATCEGYDDIEFAGAIKILVKEHESAASPKPAAILKACARVAAVRRKEAVQARSTAEGYCTLCGADRLAEGPPWPNGHARPVPVHREECPRYGAEWQVPSGYRGPAATARAGAAGAP